MGAGAKTSNNCAMGSAKKFMGEVGIKSVVGERRGRAKKQALAGGQPFLVFISSSRVYNHILDCCAKK